MNSNMGRNLKLHLARGFFALVALPLLGSFSAACGSDDSAEHRHGSLTVVGKTASAATIDGLDNLELTVTLTNNTTSAVIGPIVLTTDSTTGHGGWSGSFNDVPAGNYTVHGEARNQITNELMFATNSDGLTDRVIDIDESAQNLVLVFQEENGNTHGFTNTVPRVLSLWDQGSDVMLPGSTRTFQVVVDEPDTKTGDALTFDWVAVDSSACSCSEEPPNTHQGSADETVADPNPSVNGTQWTYTFTWTAPQTDGTYYVGATAHDKHGALVGMTMPITVGVQQQVQARVNMWPVFNDDADHGYGIQVVGPLGPYSRDGNAQILFSSSVTDPDDFDIDLTFKWETTCVGTFDADDQNSAFLTLTPADERDSIPEASSCSVSLTVTDPDGGHNTATLTIPLGSLPEPTVGGGR